MGCQSEVLLGDNLTFSICTHDPDTGVLTDADAAPTYRVYEDETGTAILNGSMAKLDDVNTTGFYTELIACTSGNGFEADKTYTVYIEATVDSDTGGIAYAFRCQGISSLSLSKELILDRIYQMLNNKMTVNETTGAVALRNIGDSSDIATGDVDSATGTTTREELTWS